jgi:hypothetical protein
MDANEFLKLMSFPREWIEWGLMPVELADELVSRYEAGHEEASEHDRNGAFHWWLRRDADSARLALLARLSWLDPDQLMASDVRKHIAAHANCDASVRRELQEVRSE